MMSCIRRKPEREKIGYPRAPAIAFTKGRPIGPAVILRMSIIDSLRFAFLFPKKLLDGHGNFLRRHENGGMIQTL